MIKSKLSRFNSKEIRIDKDHIDYPYLSNFFFDFVSDWSHVVTFVDQSWNVEILEPKSIKSFIIG